MPKDAVHPAKPAGRDPVRGRGPSRWLFRMASGTSFVADQRRHPASAFPLPQMRFPGTNLTMSICPVRGGDNIEAVQEQLFDKLIK